MSVKDWEIACPKCGSSTPKQRPTCISCNAPLGDLFEPQLVAAQSRLRHLLPLEGVHPRQATDAGLVEGNGLGAGLARRHDSDQLIVKIAQRLMQLAELITSQLVRIAGVVSDFLSSSSLSQFGRRPVRLRR